MIGDNDDTKENDLDDDVETGENVLEDGDIVEGAHEATVVDADVEKNEKKMDGTDEDEAARKREIRRRLEEENERREKDLDSTFNFNLDDDL